MYDNIQGIDEELNITINKINRCWEYLLINNAECGMKELDIIFKNIDCIINDLHSVNKDLNLSSILNAFTQLEKAIEVKDYVFISDLLKYEIKPILMKWNKELKKR